MADFAFDKKIILVGLVLSSAFAPTLVSAQKLSVEELLEQAQTENERKAVEGLIGKLRTDSKPKTGTTAPANPPSSVEPQNTQNSPDVKKSIAVNPPAVSGKIEKPQKSNPEKSNSSGGLWSIFSGWGKSQPQKTDPVKVPAPRPGLALPELVKKPASTDTRKAKNDPSGSPRERARPKVARTATEPQNTPRTSPASSKRQALPAQNVSTAASTLEQAVILANKKQLASADIEVTFDFDSNEISPKAVSALKVMGAAFTDKRLASQKFLIAGHTDAKGRKSYNWELSQKRATLIRSFLIKTFGIKEDRLIAKGFGEKHLKNELQPRAAENRRVQIINLQNSQFSSEK